MPKKMTDPLTGWSIRFVQQWTDPEIDLFTGEKLNALAKQWKSEEEQTLKTAEKKQGPK